MVLLNELKVIARWNEAVSVIPPFNFTFSYLLGVLAALEAKTFPFPPYPITSERRTLNPHPFNTVSLLKPSAVTFPLYCTPPHVLRYALEPQRLSALRSISFVIKKKNPLSNIISCLPSKHTETKRVSFPVVALCLDAYPSLPVGFS